MEKSYAGINLKKVKLNNATNIAYNTIPFWVTGLVFGSTNITKIKKIFIRRKEFDNVCLWSKLFKLNMSAKLAIKRSGNLSRFIL